MTPIIRGPRRGRFECLAAFSPRGHLKGRSRGEKPFTGMHRRLVTGTSLYFFITIIARLRSIHFCHTDGHLCWKLKKELLTSGEIILNLGKHQLPNAKGGGVLLNILVFLNSNTCSARTIPTKAVLCCPHLHFRLNLTINSSHVNLCANKDTHILNIRNAGNKLIFNFVLVFHLSTSK